MKRALIFMLLGPVLGSLVISLIVFPTAAMLEGIGFQLGPKNLILAVIGLPVAYVIGIIPAVVTCLIDWYLDVRDVRYRPVFCALVGFAVTYPFMRDSLVHPTPGSLWPLVGGMIGVLPAAVCSWLSGKRKRAEEGAPVAA